MCASASVCVCVCVHKRVREHVLVRACVCVLVRACVLHHTLGLLVDSSPSTVVFRLDRSFQCSHLKKTHVNCFYSYIYNTQCAKRASTLVKKGLNYI